MVANITKIVVYRVTLLSLLLLSVSFISHAQTLAQSGSSPREGKAEPQLLSILIDEVHNLRLTLEQNSLLQHRSNLLLARIRRQEDLIRETKAEIRALDNDMVDLADGSRYDDENDDLQDIETRINETTDLPTRLELVHEYLDKPEHRDP
jgi:hypothetical protein